MRRPGRELSRVYMATLYRKYTLYIILYIGLFRRDAETLKRPFARSKARATTSSQSSSCVFSSFMYVCMYVHTCYVLIKPPMPYITSSPLCLLRVFAS